MRILGLPSLLRSLNFNPFPHARYTYRYSSFLSPPILKLCKYVSGYQGIEFRTDRHHTNHRGYFFTRLKKLSPDKWFCFRFHKGVPGRTVIRSQGFFGNKSRFVCLFFLLPHTMPLRSYVFVCVRVSLYVHMLRRHQHVGNMHGASVVWPQGVVQWLEFQAAERFLRVEGEINKKSHCGDVNGKVPKRSLPPHILPLSNSACLPASRLQIGFCTVRCTEGGVEKKGKKCRHNTQIKFFHF